jgi:dolichyl-phosphate-mannose--protein O-mannosyl transferase
MGYNNDMKNIFRDMATLLLHLFIIVAYGVAFLSFPPVPLPMPLLYYDYPLVPVLIATTGLVVSLICRKYYKHSLVATILAVIGVVLLALYLILFLSSISA